MFVPIIMGSKSDEAHAQKIVDVLTEYNIKSEVYALSAHKVPELVLDLIAEYNKSGEEIVYITIAGRSNALSGLISANAIHPVIACPPFKDHADYLTNIHSSLQMPSGTPALTVVDPKNAALAALRILGLTDKKLRKTIAEDIQEMKETF